MVDADSSSSDSLVYQWQEDVESLEPYRPGGYHPTHIGDRYHNNRYEIVHKLGSGSYSTVWLAKDHGGDRFVAMKITAAEFSHERAEVKALQLLTAGQAHPGRSYVPLLLDEFTITGPNGNHLCIVIEAAGRSIAQTKDEYSPFKFPANVARAIAAQSLLGLEYIHSCGVIHGGIYNFPLGPFALHLSLGDSYKQTDLHSNNILFSFLYTSSRDVGDLYKQMREPRRLPVERYDKEPTGPEAPEYCVPPGVIRQVCHKMTEADARIVISDFGESFFSSDHPKQLNTPTLLLAPEYIFDQQAGSASDVWALGCTIFDILGRRHLFEGFVPTEDDALVEIISALGPLPKRWWDCWKNKSIFFNDDGSWKDNNGRHDPFSRPLSERISKMDRDKEFDLDEKLSIEKLLKGMLTYEPSERLTAKEAATSEWMRKWGIPAIREVQEHQHTNPQ